MDSNKVLSKEEIAKKKMKSQRKKEEKERIKRENIPIITTLTIIENIFSRQEMVTDPATRHVLFVDKLCMIIDIGRAAFESLQQTKLTRESREKFEKVDKLLKDSLLSLIEWIQTPQIMQNV